ncbi:MAG: beta-galactosidase [Acutalibacter sp.]
MNNAPHLLALKRLAQEVGFQAPLWTVTGWDNVCGAQIPVDEVLPVFGAYADAPWASTLEPLPPSHAFTFNRMRNDSAIGADQIAQTGPDGWRLPYERYPFATCELGGGIQVTYHRRPRIRPMDVYALALCKLGAGNNLPGYYMYHGGTNKLGRFSTLNESKESGYPNDCPILSYDFQAPLSQYGEARGQYGLLNLLHLFLQDFGELFAPMEAVEAQRLVPPEDSASLRYALRTNGEGLCVCQPLPAAPPPGGRAVRGDRHRQPLLPAFGRPGGGGLLPALQPAPGWGAPHLGHGPAHLPGGHHPVLRGHPRHPAPVRLPGQGRPLPGARPSAPAGGGDAAGHLALGAGPVPAQAAQRPVPGGGLQPLPGGRQPGRHRGGQLLRLPLGGPVLCPPCRGAPSSPPPSPGSRWRQPPWKPPPCGSFSWAGSGPSRGSGFPSPRQRALWRYPAPTTWASCTPMASWWRTASTTGRPGGCPPACCTARSASWPFRNWEAISTASFDKYPWDPLRAPGIFSFLPEKRAPRRILCYTYP